MIESLKSSSARPTFKEAVRFWWKLGWISFGGTAAHIALMHDDLVEKKQWVANDLFFHALSHCMLLPGPEAQQLAIYLGWKLHGRMGGIVAGLLFVLPSMFVLLALSVVYVQFGGLPWIAAMFTALKPTVVALVILALIRVARRALTTMLQRSVCLGALAATIGFHVSLPVVMLIVISLGILGSRTPSHPAQTKVATETIEPSILGPKEITRSLITISASALALWLCPLMALRFMSRDPFWTQLCFFFTRTAFVTFGGSYTVIPYVAHVAVAKYHWLSEAQMLDGFALAETTPGPLIIVVAFVGFMAGFNHFHHSVLQGTLALLATTFYTFLPCFLFVFAGAPFVEKTHGKPGIERILRLITAVVVAAMLDLTIFLIHGVLFPGGIVSLRGLDSIALGWIAISLLLLRTFKMNVALVIGLSLILGFARWVFRIA